MRSQLRPAKEVAPGLAPLPVCARRAMLALITSPVFASFAAAQPGQGAAPALVFPHDLGSHPESRIEWWYITGHASSGTHDATRSYGFQLTFFRSRVAQTQAMESRFAARNLLFAHAAITDVSGKRFWHDQRITREGFGVATASQDDTAVRLRDWSLLRRNGRYEARIQATDFSIDLSFSETQGLLLQGNQGLSRKGPDPRQFSHYYSKPQLAFDGELRIQGKPVKLSGDGSRSANSEFKPGTGAAWLDHEWSDSFLHPQAVGWDWIGINLFDGSALTAFRLRDKSGNTLWDGGSFRHPKVGYGKKSYVFSRGETAFQPVRGWKSALTQATYPVEWLLRTPSDNYLLQALLDNQELDSRNSTGAVYWEGLCDLFDSNRRHVGRGYLEMTGYAKPLVL
ncbi:MAG: carotenoid 1,2-hydratase [Burkholderiaceae bacterium]